MSYNISNRRANDLSSLENLFSQDSDESRAIPVIRTSSRKGISQIQEQSDRQQKQREEIERSCAFLSTEDIKVMSELEEDEFAKSVLKNIVTKRNEESHDALKSLSVPEIQEKLQKIKDTATKEKLREALLEKIKKCMKNIPIKNLEEELAGYKKKEILNESEVEREAILKIIFNPTPEDKIMLLKLKNEETKASTSTSENAQEKRLEASSSRPSRLELFPKIL